MTLRRDIAIGTKFNRLIVLSIPVIHKGHRMYICQCDCDKIVIVRGSALLTKNTLSCGCLNNELVADLGINTKTHGYTGTPEYWAYKHMIDRCYNIKTSNYKNYGGRGIVVCERWLQSFDNFIADMGDKPTKKHSLDRVNNDGNYRPGNCRWALLDVQAANKTYTVRLRVNGEEIHQSGLARKLGITPNAIEYHRKKGLTGDQIFTHFNSK